jgi:Domain of unknown function (DUF4397)
MFRLLKALPLTLALAALSFFTASCGSSNQAQIRVINAIPDSPTAGLDVDVNGTKITTAALTFTDVQPTPPAYTKVASGSVTIQAFDTGTTTNPIFGTNGVTASLSGSSQYTIVLAGFLNGTGTNPLAALQITDNNTAPSSGNVEFRIINASPSVVPGGTVDVYIVPPGTDINQVNPPTIQGLAYQQASNPYTSLAAATYSVIVTSSGTKQEIIFPQDYTLVAGQIRTLVLVDNAGGGNPPSWLELVDLN